MSESESSGTVRAVPPLDQLNRYQQVRQVLGVSSPIIAALVSQNLLNIVDTWIVGQLGALELACVALSGIITWVLVAFFIGLGAGVQAQVARRVGEGDIDGAVGPLNQSLIFIISLVIPLSVIVSSNSDSILSLSTSKADILWVGGPYLAIRLAGLPFTAANFSFRGYWNGLSLSTIYMRTLLFIHVINIVLTYVFVFGVGGFPELGVFGAGLGTTISQAVGTAYYFYLARNVGASNGFMKRRYTTSMRDLLRLGAPAGLQTVLFSVGFLIFFTLTERLGTQALGATQVVVTMMLVSILPAVGFGLGCASLVGQSLGAGRPNDAARWGWVSVAVGASVVGVIGLIEALTASHWMHLFVTTDPAAAQMGVTPLRIIGACMLIDAVGVILMNTLIGAGAILSVTLWSAFCQYAVFLPLAWYVGIERGGGLVAMWAAFAFYRCLFSVVMVIQWVRGKWKTARV